MVAVCVVGSADTAKCADCTGGSVYRCDGELVRHIIWWSAILICSGCYWAPGTVFNWATAWFVGCWSCWAPLGTSMLSSLNESLLDRVKFHSAVCYLLYQIDYHL